MKLIIDNIGKIKHAEISFNGITVLAGENNTGKSTVGKALFSIFHSCFDIENYILRQKILRARREITKILKANVYVKDEYESFDFFETLDFNPLYKSLITNLFDNHSKEKVVSFLKSSLPDSLFSRIDSHDEVVEAIENTIEEIKNLPNKMYYVSRVWNTFNSVFEGQYLNFNSERGYVDGIIKGKRVSAEFNEDSCSDFNLDFIFTNQAILLDTPSILDDLSERTYRSNIIKYTIVKKLNCDERSDSADVDSTITAQKLSRIFDLLNGIVPGKFQKSEFTQDRSFLFKGMSKPLKLKNLSQGIKSFLIIKRLCENGQFTEKDVLILDEPEINLHPSWQLVYAELVVLLQKEYNLTILLSTHSPYFLSAIEAYSKKYDIVNKCTFYLSDNDENGNALFTDVTNNTEKIYTKLVKPFDTIAEIESEMRGDD
ncbi:MAG: ATP-binding protein [Oscillospiraceae bacterium]|nr:ATP-binding protein [Oscillospiraceae bacterium]